SNNNANTSGNYQVQGHQVQVVRGVGLIGGGKDPLQEVLALSDASAATAHLRAEDHKRLREIRRLVVSTVNNQPIRIDDVVDGGSLHSTGQRLGEKGVVAGHQTRLGRISISRPRLDDRGRPVRDSLGNPVWDDNDDAVQAIVLLRKGYESLPALADV